MTTHVLMYVFRAWLLELPVSWVNYYVLVKRVYEPRFGELRAHQIGMSTRIVYVLIYCYAVVHVVGRYTAVDLVYAGLFWMGLWLAFEWFGSALLRRPVREILLGWHVKQGYMWPFVVGTYLIAPLAIGELLGPAGVLRG